MSDGPTHDATGDGPSRRTTGDRRPRDARPGRRRARKRPRRGLGLPARCWWSLAVARRRPLLRRHQGRRRCVKDQFADARGLRRARAPARSIVRGRGGRHRRRDRPQPRRTAGVVASVEAFTDAADGRRRVATGIQVGFYELKKEMAADDALDDPGRPRQPRCRTPVTIPEGLRVDDIVDDAGQEDRLHRGRSTSKVLDEPRGARPARLRRRATRRATSSRRPTTSAPNDDAGRHADRDGRPLAAGRRGRRPRGARPRSSATPPRELMTVASLVEAEADRGEDRGKVARVIYNRLETRRRRPTACSQIDATVNYALGRDARRGADRRRSSQSTRRTTPTSTRACRPAPIEAPGRRGDRGGREPGRRATGSTT